MIDIGKVLLTVGVVLIFFGLIFTFFPKIPFLGKLPGDILIKKGGFTFYAPIVSSILVSILLSFLFGFFKHK